MTVTKNNSGFTALINNAGTIQVGPVELMSEEEFDSSSSSISIISTPPAP